MSLNGHVVIDMDQHIREYVDVDRVYRDNIDPAYRDAFERLSAAVAERREAGQPANLFMHPNAIIEPSDESRPLGMQDTFGTRHGTKAPDRAAPDRGAAEIPREVHWDPSIRLADMDKAGIDLCVIFPSHATSYVTLRDAGFESALQHAYHRYVANYCGDGGGRLRWALIATLRDVPGTVEQLTHWAEHDANLAGVMIPPAGPNGRLLDNPDYHPIYQAAQDLDLPLLVHGGVLRPPYTPGAVELDNAGFIIRSVYQPWAGMTAVSALIGGGVFDLFPRLRAGVFETGGGWMPWLIERLDDSYASRPHLAPFLKRKPSEVIAEGRLFHAFDPTERYVGHAIEELGEDMWLFSTDYPHAASLPWPNDVTDFTERPDLSGAVKRKVMGENALRLCPRFA